MNTDFDKCKNTAPEEPNHTIEENVPAPSESGTDQDFYPQLPPQRRRRKTPTRALLITAFALIAAGLCVVFVFIGKKVAKRAELKIKEDITAATDVDAGWAAPDYVKYEPIVENEYSRPATPLEKINGIVVHYVGNPGTTAAQNRSYFNGLAASGATWASSHFVIGLEGEILQLIPLDEIAYCSNERNADTVSIECCHPAEDGKFTDKTYESLVNLTADLCAEYGLNPLKDVIRHYDVTGKLCPLYFVEHEDEWREFLTDVAAKVTAGK